MNGIDSLFKFLGGKGFRDLFLFLSHVELLRINNFLPVFNLFLPRSLDSRKFGLKLSSFYKCENRLSVKVGIKWVSHGRSYLKCHSFSGFWWRQPPTPKSLKRQLSRLAHVPR